MNNYFESLSNTNKYEDYLDAFENNKVNNRNTSKDYEVNNKVLIKNLQKKYQLDLGCNIIVNELNSTMKSKSILSSNYSLGNQDSESDKESKSSM